jgi:predicted ATPase
VVIPELVRATVLRRLMRMQRSDRAIVMRASVIGRRFSLGILVATVPCSEPKVRQALEGARQHQLVVAGDGAERYAFRHALIREIIYGEFISAATRPLHRRIVAALERSLGSDDATLEDLAYHAWAGGDAKRTLRYNELAGDKAASVHARDDARTFYGRARSASEFDSPGYVRLTAKLRTVEDSS